jgi:hypothetical protein
MVVLPRMAFVLTSFALGVSLSCEAQSSEPALKVHAYEREVVGGIPGGPPGGGAGPRHMRYVIYLEAPPNARVAVDGLWMKGTYYSVETAARKTPVRFEAPVTLAEDARNVAVPATTNTVTEVVPRDAVPDKTPDTNTSNALRENEAVLQVTYSGKTTLVPIKKFERAAPLYLK